MLFGPVMVYRLFVITDTVLGINQKFHSYVQKSILARKLFLLAGLVVKTGQRTLRSI